MLETIWFILWGVLWSVYFMLDGYDLGLGSLLPFLAKNETDRRLVYRAMGPFWDGNEVWLITAGGVTFAAFPTTYAMMFSSLYSPLMLILFALIFRGVSLAFRGEVDNPRWKAFWDGCLVVGSFLPALLFGVAFANIFRGLPIDAAGIYQGNLFTLLNPYGLAGGVLFVLPLPGARLPVAGGQNRGRPAGPGRGHGGPAVAGAPGGGGHVPPGHPHPDPAL